MITYQGNRWEGGREGGREGGGREGGRDNLTNIYKCKVSPGGTFSLGNFLFDERENYQILLGHKERKFTFFYGQREKWQKIGEFARHIHVYLSIGSNPLPPEIILL